MGATKEEATVTERAFEVTTAEAASVTLSIKLHVPVAAPILNQTLEDDTAPGIEEKLVEGGALLNH